MNEGLEYSNEGILNVDLFFTNDINFYIEDNGKEYRYESIFRELFDIKIERIFALNGKNNLKVKFKELKKNNKLKNNFFIADLDFDYLLEKDLIEDGHFIYLEKYEIENYIIDEKSVTHYLKNELCCLESKAKKLLNYEKWTEKTNRELYNLFILYLIVQYEDIGIENTNENANKYFDEKGNVKASQVEAYYNRLDKELIKLNKDINKEILICEEIVKEKYNMDYTKFIKGKYILIGLRKYISNILSKENNKTIKIREKNLIDTLYDFFDKASLSFIKHQIETYLEI